MSVLAAQLPPDNVWEICRKDVPTHTSEWTLLFRFG